VSELDFEVFYRESRDAVYRAVVLATRSPDRAEEAVAEAYARAIARWDTVASHPNREAWVARTALNQFISGWRRWRREAAEVPDVASVPDEARSLDPFLVRQLWRLPRRQREVVALRILLDLDAAQTGEALGIAPATVGVHLSRALAQLRASVTHAYDQEVAR
jgi:RNA polymerase sigma factor (sigma-70 family)